MRKLSELESHFEIPEMDKSTLLTMVIMKNGKPVYRDIHIFGRALDYRISSCSQDYTPIPKYILDITDIPNIVILNTTVRKYEGEYGVYKSLRLHFKEILRNADIGPLISRYYGVLSGRILHKYLDMFLIKSLKSECGNKETFAENYNAMLNTLINELDIRATDILKSIKSDNIRNRIVSVVASESGTLISRMCGDDIIQKCEVIPLKVKESKKDITDEFTSRFQNTIDDIRNNADPNGLSKYVKYDDPEIDGLGYLGFYKTKDGQIAPFINDEKTNSLSSILLENFNNFSVSRTLSELMYIRSNNYNYPTISPDILNIIFVKYKNKNNIIIMIAGSKHEQVMFSDVLGIDISAIDEIFNKLDKIKYLKLYSEKRTIKNLWGVLG